MNRITQIYLFVLIALFVSRSSYGLAYDSQDCIRCHSEKSRESHFRISPEEFKNSAHGEQLECQDCHLEASDPRHEQNKTVTRVDCYQECHTQENSHGKGEARDRLPQCYDCHTKHSILPAKDPLSSVYWEKLKITCAGCHPKESGRQGIVRRVLFFKLAAHRKGDFAGVFDFSRCVDCHQGNAAHGELAPLNNKPCQKCHDVSFGGGFLLGSIHGTVVSTSNPIGLIGQAYYFFFIVSGIFLLGYGFYQRRKLWRSGRTEDRSGHMLKRVFSFVVFGIGHRKILEDRLAGVAHIGIMAGFMVPLLYIIAIQVPFTLTPLISHVLGLILDLSGLCGIVGVLIAALRRGYGSKKSLVSLPRDWIVLAVLMGIFVTGFLVGGGKISLASEDNIFWTPVRFLFSMVVSPDPLLIKYLWRIHFLLVVGLITFIPFSKLRHAVTASLNIYYRTIGVGLELKPVRMERGQIFGASRRQEFTWKQLLDADACMECGRCEEQCPASASGKPLSPKKVIKDLKKHMEKDHARDRIVTGVPHNVNPLLGEMITDDEIWACTTCHACQHICPVFVEHVPSIINMRRYLVLDICRFPSELKGVFRRLEIYGDTYGKGPARRTEWTKNLKVNVPAEPGKSEYLLWVGCEGAFHDRNREVVISLAKVLLKAGLDFAILGNEERCCGDTARRIGNEYLFQCLARENIGLLKRYGVKRIIAFCAHCFHTLKNEYPQWGGDFEVFHYTEILADLVERGALELKVPIPGRVTFHDPCYLGRVNGIYQPSRSVLRAIPGLDLLEMDRSLERSFCCGAGGGRMWMHEHLGKRINRIRTEEAVAVRPEIVVTSCPYCLTMFEDGIGSTKGDGLPKAKDLAELVVLSME